MKKLFFAVVVGSIAVAFIARRYRVEQQLDFDFRDQIDEMLADAKKMFEV